LGGAFTAKFEVYTDIPGKSWKPGKGSIISNGLMGHTTRKHRTKSYEKNWHNEGKMLHILSVNRSFIYYTFLFYHCFCCTNFEMFGATDPPLPLIVYQESLTAADACSEYFS